MMDIKNLPYMLLLVSYTSCVELPGSCNSSQYYDPGSMACESCPVNVSMVTSSDGYSCSCSEHSIRVAPGRCKLCNATEMVSSDGKACVPRLCQAAKGKTVCRKCPQDYISVTQNLDGTPLKEVQCVKCARGFKALNNACVRCESCACAKSEIVVRERCVPKRFTNDRPKPETTLMHPNEMLDVVKNEYLCTQNDLLACRILANECVKNFYSTVLAGPCRLWIQPKVTTPKGLPKLILESSASEKDPSEIALAKGMKKIHLALASYETDGGLKMIYEPNEKYPCFLPLKITIGSDYSSSCYMNISQIESPFNETVAPFLYIQSEMKALPVALRRSNGDYVQFEQRYALGLRHCYIANDNGQKPFLKSLLKSGLKTVTVDSQPT